MSGGTGPDDRPAIGSLPDALGRLEEIRRRLGDRPVAVFLDFDGTLAPIVGDPDAAALSGETREVLEELARRCPVAVVSGREVEDVAARVGLEGIHYAGSHGLELRGPGGYREVRAEDRLPALDAAEEDLREALDGVPGVRVERKRLGLAVHTRGAPEDASRVAERRVRRRATRRPELQLHRGKEVLELRPGGDWDKGRALERLLDRLLPEGEGAWPIYVGDDVTDEDAFRAVADRGVPVVVRGEDDGRATGAEYSLADPGAVRRFLRALTGILEERRE